MVAVCKSAPPFQEIDIRENFEFGVLSNEKRGWEGSIGCSLIVFELIRYSMMYYLLQKLFDDASLQNEKVCYVKHSVVLNHVKVFGVSLNSSYC